MINPNIRVTRCSGDEILVKHGTRSHFSQILRDDGRTRLLGRIFRHLVAPHSLQDLRARDVIRESEMDDAAGLIRYLADEQILISPDESVQHLYLAKDFGRSGVERLRGVSVGILGSGFLGSRVARELNRLSVRELVLMDHRTVRSNDALYFDMETDGDVPLSYPDVVRRALATPEGVPVACMEAAPDDPEALDRLFARADFVVGSFESFSPSALHAANRAALSAGKPWMSVYTDGGEALVGPIYVPGQTPCYNEFEVQNEANLTIPEDYLVYKETLLHEETGQPANFVPPPS